MTEKLSCYVMLKKNVMLMKGRKTVLYTLLYS